MSSFFEKLYRITDDTGKISRSLLAKINENFKILEMTLQGKLTSENILNGSITDDSIKSSDTWNTAVSNALQALVDAATAQDTADGQIQGFFQDTAPVLPNMSFGDIWIDTDGHNPPTVDDIYRYANESQGSSGELDWQLASTNAIGKIYLSAYLAQTTAESKITTYYQANTPTGDLSVGDIWIKTSENNKQYRWNGTSWDTASNTSVGIGMGIDSNCTGLWHFDGSLNSNKGDVAITTGGFADSNWGQGINIQTGEYLKIPTASIINPGETSVNLRVYNLSSSVNGSVILHLPDNLSNQAVICGISDVVGHEGELYIEDAKADVGYVVDSQAEFNTGTLSDVEVSSEGIVTIEEAEDIYTYTETSEADFGTGTLSQVVAKSTGDLELDKETTGYTSDVTGSGAAISGGDNASYPKEQAFDESTANYWESSQTGSAVANTAYIGYDFGSGVTKHIRKLKMLANVNHYMIPSAKLQRSNDGTNWTDVQSLTLSTYYGDAWQEFIIGASGDSRYWRLLATSNTTDGTYPWRVKEIEMMESTEAYYTSGYREVTLDISREDTSKGSLISWEATTPANTAIQIQAALSTDGGANYSSYQDCTNGGTIPGLTNGIDLTSARLKIKETLTTSNTAATPKLSSLSVTLLGGYKSSGYWEKEYDFSIVGIVGSSSVLYSSTTPDDTTCVLKAAVSTDGGLNYGSYQTCENGGAVTGVTENMDASGLFVKFKVELATADETVTPELDLLGAEITGKNTKVYGANKSTLTEWDNIAIEWKAERLSLIINGAESVYIENPVQVVILSDYIYLGSDADSNNQIGTIIDELRIDNMYNLISKVDAWYVMDSPFYTSEEFKQFPGYVKAETNGLNVYDSENNLRVLVGSWLNGVIRKYGIKIINGEIYSSLVSTGEENAKTYIRLVNPNLLQMYSEVDGVAKKQLEIAAPDGGGGGGVDFYIDDEWIGTISGENGTDLYIGAPYGDVVMSSLNVTGSKNCIENTSAGTVGISARESPEVRYIDEGIGTLADGICRIDIDPIFLEVTEPNTVKRWIMQVTPYADINLYISEIGDSYFIVKEGQGGLTTGAEFGWLISAARRGYSDVRFKQIGKLSE